MDRLMGRRRSWQRRSGAAFLALVSATNVIVWLEPVARSRVAGDLASSSEIRLGLASCLLAVGVAITAWVLGRRPRAGRPENPKARSNGLVLSILSALLNMAFAGAILLRAPHFTGPSSLLSLVAIVWYVVLLPLQVVAAYWSGRGTVYEGRRRTQA
jgi:hypothetical protein